MESENEKSGGVKWFTKEDLNDGIENLEPMIKYYALDALEKLCK